MARLRKRRNCAGARRPAGAINLITPEKRVQAADLRSGRSVSLSRDFPDDPCPGNPMPAQHFVRLMDSGVVDYYGMLTRVRATHIDALCHGARTACGTAATRSRR
jgi:hypothetical protein